MLGPCWAPKFSGQCWLDVRALALRRCCVPLPGHTKCCIAPGCQPTYTHRVAQHDWREATPHQAAEYHAMRGIPPPTTAGMYRPAAHAAPGLREPTAAMAQGRWPSRNRSPPPQRPRNICGASLVEALMRTPHRGMRRNEVHRSLAKCWTVHSPAWTQPENTKSHGRYCPPPPHTQ